MRKDSSRRQPKYPKNEDTKKHSKGNSKKLSRAQQKQRDYIAACEYDW